MDNAHYLTTAWRDYVAMLAKRDAATIEVEKTAFQKRADELYRDYQIKEQIAVERG